MFVKFVYCIFARRNTPRAVIHIRVYYRVVHDVITTREFVLKYIRRRKKLTPSTRTRAVVGAFRAIYSEKRRRFVLPVRKTETKTERN